MGGAETVIQNLMEKSAMKFECKLALPRIFIKVQCTYWNGPTLGLLGLLREDVDVIHSHLFWGGFFVRIRRLWDRNFTWVHTIHYDDYGSLRFGRIKRYLDHHWIYPRADHLVAVSASCQTQLDCKIPSLHIPNGIDLHPCWNQERVHNRLRSDSIQLTCTARFRFEKGHDLLLNALEELNRGKKRFHLNLIGDGPRMRSIQDLVRERNLSSCVTFHGFTSPSSILKETDIYVQPSRSESFGLAILEAMEHSCAIVATQVGNIPNLLKFGEFGKLVSLDEWTGQTLASAILESAENLLTHRRNGHLGALQWSKTLSSQRMIEEYHKIYAQGRPTGILITSPLVTQGIGGLQRQILLQSKALKEEGYRIYLLQRHDPQLSQSKDLRERWAHLHIIQTPCIFAHSRRLAALTYILFGFLHAFLIRHQFEIVHAHQLYSPTLLGAIIKRLLAKSLVVKVTASGELGEARELQRLGFRRIRSWAFGQIDQLLTLDPSMRQEMVDFVGIPSDKVQVLPNSVEVPTRTTSLSLHGDGTRKFTILYVGRLSTEKSLETLFEAFQLLPELGKLYRIDVVGKGYRDRDAEPLLRRLAQDLNSHLEIRFMGSQEDVKPFYQTSDLFVLPSRSEGLSNALLEAMSYGLLCVVSQIPPNEYLVQDGLSGYTFPVGDSKALAMLLKKIGSNLTSEGEEIQRIRQNARAKIRDHFSDRHIGHQIHLVYEKILQKTSNEMLP